MSDWLGRIFGVKVGMAFANSWEVVPYRSTARA
jgi:hypothetical protein